MKEPPWAPRTPRQRPRRAAPRPSSQRPRLAGSGSWSIASRTILYASGVSETVGLVAWRFSVVVAIGDSLRPATHRAVPGPGDLAGTAHPRIKHLGSCPEIHASP